MKTQLIVACDVDTLKEARKAIDRLAPRVKIFKIGSQLFTACGPEVVRYVQRRGARVFLDLKFHDIPNTVAKAAAAATRLGVFMMTLHAGGGPEMLRAAREAAGEAAKANKIKRPLLVAVTVLTSQTCPDVQARVLALARSASGSGVDGVVASVEECALIKQSLGPEFLVVTPGIRPAGASVDDQKRIATPAQARQAGSDFIVVGRPIIAAPDPAAAARAVLKEIKA